MSETKTRKKLIVKMRRTTKGADLMILNSTHGRKEKYCSYEVDLLLLKFYYGNGTSLCLSALLQHCLLFQRMVSLKFEILNKEKPLKDKV